MATYDAGDAKLRIVADASRFRKSLEEQLRSQQAEFVLQVRADAARAREDIDRLRREEEARAVDLRVRTSTARANEQVDRMRAEQEARAMHLRVNVDESSVSRSSRAVENARRPVRHATALAAPCQMPSRTNRRCSRRAFGPAVGVP